MNDLLGPFAGGVAHACGVEKRGGAPRSEASQSSTPASGSFIYTHTNTVTAHSRSPTRLERVFRINQTRAVVCLTAGEVDLKATQLGAAFTSEHKPNDVVSHLHVGPSRQVRSRRRPSVVVVHGLSISSLSLLDLAAQRPSAEKAPPMTVHAAITGRTRASAEATHQ